MWLFIFTNTLLCLGFFTSKIGDWLHKYFNPTTEQENNLLEHRNALKKEQSTLSNVADFVKHSKLQREINKIEEYLKIVREKDLEAKVIQNLIIKKGPRVLHGVIVALNIIWNHKTPIFVVGEEYSLFPFGFIISFPIFGVPNAVSVQFWTACVHAGLELIKTKIK